MTQMDSDLLIGNTSSSSSSSTIMNNYEGGNQTPRLIQQYNWYYDKSELKRTPSILDNISYEQERINRSEGARFIVKAGVGMKLLHDTLATGVVYFHRFYMTHSFRVFPRFVTAACCLFLAGKAEETPKKCKDIIKIAKALLSEQDFATFGDDPKEEVLTLERIVLQTIRFDLQVEHPYKYLVSYLKCFKGRKDDMQNLLQTAWTLTNDSLCTTICLQWEPEIVAIAMIFLASKIYYNIDDWEGRLPHHKHWWDLYVEDLSVELLEDICHQVLDLYSKPKEVSKPAQLPSGSSPQTPQPVTPSKPSFPSVLPNTPAPSFRPIDMASTSQQVPTNTAVPAAVPIPPALAPIPPGIPPPPPPPVPPPTTQWDAAALAAYYQKYNNFQIVNLAAKPNANAAALNAAVAAHLAAAAGIQAPLAPGIVGTLAAPAIARLPGQPLPPPPPPPPFVPGVNHPSSS